MMEAAEAIERGIVAARDHNQATAYYYFYAATQADPDNEQAWLWRASTAPRPRDALFCLAAVLAINPDNPVARHGIEQISAAIAAERDAPIPPAQPSLPAGEHTPADRHRKWQSSFRDTLHDSEKVGPMQTLEAPGMPPQAIDPGRTVEAVLERPEHATDRDAEPVPTPAPPPAPARPPSLGKQVVQGAMWNYGGFLVSKGLLFVATLILARILSPSEFGLVGMALLVITALDILRDFGIGASLIYRQRDGQAAANLAFLLSAVIGVMLFVGNWLLAPFVTVFFKTNGPEETATVTGLVQVLGFSLLFAGLGSTQDALLQKAIDYRRRMIPEVGRTLIKGVLQVALALAGFGVWSLVWGQVIGEACATILLWTVSSWRPTRLLDRTLLRPMVNYGTQIMMVGGLGWLVADIDYLIIGRFLGDAALGLYTLAFRIPELIIRNLAQAVSNVAFPVAARFQEDKAAMRHAYLTMQHYMLAILAPLGFGLFAVTPSLIHILFQDKWEPAIPVMELLSIYMVLSGISHWPGVVYKAVGRPDILNRLSFLKLVLLAPTLWWAATTYGIVGVGWGQVAVRVVVILIDMWTVSRFVQISMRANLQAIWPPLAASAIMAAAVRLVFLLDPRESSIPLLAVAIITGGAVYAGALWLLDRPTVSALLDLARGLVARRRRIAPAPDAG
ncbi:MAG TPA: lipopolysaccharide biosynthesis protein [Chloroflexia bacterium]|nr:lipopolysaccharide biosynthesis protein [Chloroflexia bacterium]